MSGSDRAPVRQAAPEAPLFEFPRRDDADHSTGGPPYPSTETPVDEAQKAAELQRTQHREQSARQASSDGEVSQLHRKWPQRSNPRFSNRIQRPSSQGSPSAAGASSSVGEGDMRASSRPDNSKNDDDDDDDDDDDRRRGSEAMSPPQRPRRPSYVPSLDISRTPESPTGEQPAYRRWEDDYQRVAAQQQQQQQQQHPGRASASFSNTSSVYSPLFSPAGRMLPTSPDYPSASSNLGRRAGTSAAAPARRANQTYHSHYSHVTPIPEEGPGSHGSHGSFASSRVIPSSWGSALSDEVYSWQLRHSSHDDPSPDIPRGDPFGTIPEEEDWRDAAGDGIAERWDEAPSGAGVGQDAGTAADVSSLSVATTGPDEASRGTPPTSSHGGASAARTPAQTRTPTPDLRTAFAVAMSGGVDVNGPNRGLGVSSPGEPFGRAGPTLERSRSALSSASALSPTPPRPVADPRAQQILHGLRKGTSIEDRSTSRSVYVDTDELMRKEIRAQRRAQRPIAEAPKEPEMRSSLTSLPDLIRRATKLATALDRGRPNSRVELDPGLSRDEKGERRGAHSRSGSIADMLAYFPSPGTRDGTTSAGSGYPNRRPGSNGPALARSSNRDGSFDTTRRRRCCGMPMWSFVVLIALALLIVTAAIVLPIVLVVLPRQGTTGATGSLADCEAETQCLNGGSSVLDGNSCRCVCGGGFTGDRCEKAPNDPCVTADFSSGQSQLQGVKVGSAMQRLFRQGADAFDVPLDVPAIISAFSAQDLSCVSQNALVTFNGRSMPLDAAASVSSSTPRLVRRQSNPSPSSDFPLTLTAPATTLGTFVSSLVTQRGTPTGSVNATATGATTTADGGGGGGGSGSTQTDEDNMLDFARVGVLYVLQVTNWDTAVGAQTRIQTFFNSRTQGRNSLTVSDDIGLDLQERTLIWANGTVVGGGGSGSISD